MSDSDFKGGRENMRKNLPLICSVVGVIVGILVYSGRTAPAAEFIQGSKPAAHGGQNSESTEKSRLVVLRLGKNNDGPTWEATFIDLPDSSNEIRAKLGDTVLLERIKSWTGKRVTVETSPDVPSRAAEETLVALVKAGIENIYVVGPYVVHGGRIYYMSSQDNGITDPELVVDRAQLREVATLSGLVEKAYRWPDGRKVLAMQLLIDEAGKITEIMWGITPLAAEMRAKIIPNIKVTKPAHRGVDAVPGVAMVRIDVQ